MALDTEKQLTKFLLKLKKNFENVPFWEKERIHKRVSSLTNVATKFVRIVVLYSIFKSYFKENS